MDSVGLEKFNATLHCVITVMKNLRYQGDLQSQENLRRIVARLPVELKRKWAGHMVENDLDRANLLHLDFWLQKQVRVALDCAPLNQQSQRLKDLRCKDYSHRP